MRMGRSFQEEDTAIQMAPLIDIIFLTLVFFMVTSVYATLESEVDISLPTADSAVQTERSQGEIFINLQRDGTIVVNGRVMDMETLQEVLYRVAEHFPGGTVILRGDKGVALGKAVEVLDRCRKADIQNISIAALTPEQASEAAEGGS